MIRRMLLVSAWLLVAAMAYVVMTFVQVYMTANDDEAAPSQAIVVLGAAHYGGRPSPVFQARLDHAATLFDEGMAPLVVVTGGTGAGDQVSEGFVGYRYLRGLGVPDESIAHENGGLTSYESLAAAARFLIADGIRDVILVSDGWHLRRSAAIASEVGLNPLPSPTPTSPYSAGRAVQQMVRETAGLSLGRIIGFRRLDWLLDSSTAGVTRAALGLGPT